MRRILLIAAVSGALFAGGAVAITAVGSQGADDPAGTTSAATTQTTTTQTTTRWKRVLLVTLIVTVPRSLSRRRKLRALRLTDTIVPSNWRVAAWVATPVVFVVGVAALPTAAVVPSAASEAATTAIFLICISPSLGVRRWGAIRMRSGRPTAVQGRGRVRPAEG